MNKRILIISLMAISLLSIVYAIYRSTAEKITITEPGPFPKQTVYGEPQHGLILGLCVFAGACVIALVLLLLDREEPRPEQKTTPVSKRTATNYPQ
jgi:hypothetical protein